MSRDPVKSYYYTMVQGRGAYWTSRVNDQGQWSTSSFLWSTGRLSHPESISRPGVSGPG